MNPSHDDVACRSCDTSLEEGTRFCSACGARSPGAFERVDATVAMFDVGRFNDALEALRTERDRAAVGGDEMLLIYLLETARSMVSVLEGDGDSAAHDEFERIVSDTKRTLEVVSEGSVPQTIGRAREHAASNDHAHALELLYRELFDALSESQNQTGDAHGADALNLRLGRVHAAAGMIADEVEPWVTSAYALLQVSVERGLWPSAEPAEPAMHSTVDAAVVEPGEVGWYPDLERAEACAGGTVLRGGSQTANTMSATLADCRIAPQAEALGLRSKRTPTSRARADHRTDDGASLSETHAEAT